MNFATLAFSAWQNNWTVSKDLYLCNRRLFYCKIRSYHRCAEKQSCEQTSQYCTKRKLGRMEGGTSSFNAQDHLFRNASCTESKWRTELLTSFGSRKTTVQIWITNKQKIQKLLLKTWQVFSFLPANGYICIEDLQQWEKNWLVTLLVNIYCGCLQQQE